MPQLYRFMCVVFMSLCVSMPLGAEEIIVTAPAPPRDVPGSVQDRVPTAGVEIIATTVTSPGLIDTVDALKRSSSVDLPDYGGAVTAPLALRGSNFQQTLVLLDGFRLNPVNGDMTDVSLYPLGALERIEVVKGSQGATFGKTSMGGVVNLVTRKAGDEPEFSLISSQGTHDERLYSATASGRLADGVSGLLLVTQGDAEGDFLYERTDGTTVRRENNDHENTAVLTTLEADLGDWQTAALFNLFTQEKGMPGGEGWLDPTSRKETTQGNLQLRAEGRLNDTVSLEVSGGTLQSRETRDETVGELRSRLSTDELRIAVPVELGAVALLPEFTYLKEKIDSDDYDRHSRYSRGAALQAVCDLDPVIVDLGVRYDDSSAYDGEWTTHAGLFWQVLSWLGFRGNVGSAYAEPTMGQLYAPSSYQTFVPNPDLEPESSRSFDVGAEVGFDMGGASLSWFVVDYEDMIKMVQPDSSSFSYENIAKVHASGVEASGWLRPVDEVTVSGSYVRDLNRFASGEFESKRLDQKPEDVFTVQMGYAPVVMDHRTSLFVAYQYREGVYADKANSMKTGDRNLLSAGVSVEASDHAMVSCKVENIGDDRSPEYFARSGYGDFWYPVTGRTWHLSMRIDF